LAREDAIPPLTPEFDSDPPKRRLPDPCDALEQQREPTALSVEEATDPIELGLAADDTLARQPSYSGSCQQRPPFRRA